MNEATLNALRDWLIALPPILDPAGGDFLDKVYRRKLVKAIEDELKVPDADDPDGTRRPQESRPLESEL